MRFAVIGSRGYPSTYGGFETFVRTLVPYAIADGHEVVVYGREGGRRNPPLIVDGAECVRTRGLDSKHLSTPTYGLSSCWDARRRDLDAALVLNCANGYWLPLLRSAGVPAAVNVDGLEWERGKWNRVGRAVFRGGARVATRVATSLVSDSRAIAEIWQRDLGRRPAYIPYGGEIVTDDAADALAPLGIEPGSYALTVARLVPENNVELVVDGVRRLEAQTRPTHVIVGSGTPGDAASRWMQAHASESKRVVWLGHVSDQRLLSQLFRHALVYLHGHSVGGTNPALLQALGAGAPSLAFDVGFNREVLGDCDAYFSSADDLAQRLTTLIASPEQARALSERGREIVRSRYSWDSVCRRYIDLLQEIAGQVPATGAVRHES